MNIVGRRCGIASSFNQREIEEYYGKERKGVAAVTMRNLERSSKFKDALDTEVGRLIFDDLILLLDEKFMLIYNEEDKPMDRAIFKACTIIGERWNKILKQYMGSVNRIKNKIR